MPRPEVLFQRLFIPLDGSCQSEEVLPLAVAMASGCPESRITLAGYAANAAEVSACEPYLSDVAQCLEKEGVATHWLIRREGTTAGALLGAAAEVGADLVMLAAREHSRLARWLLGSVSEEIIRGSVCPVFVLKSGQRADGAFRNILVALDGSEFSERVLEPVSRLARQNSASVTLLTVCSPPLAHEQPLATMEHLEGKRLELEQAGVTSSARLAFGDPALTILEVAQECHCDLVVVHSHGRQGRDRFWLGSVAEKVMRHSQCPTLVWK